MNEWRVFGPMTAVRAAPCVMCRRMSSWHPKNWAYRYTSVRGGSRKDPKVRYERICPNCVGGAVAAVEP